jgi:hypothetical protein
MMHEVFDYRELVAGWPLGGDSDANGAAAWTVPPLGRARIRAYLAGTAAFTGEWTCL